jgi:hypothetical protein
MECAAGEVGSGKDWGRDLVWLVVPDTAGNCVTNVSDVAMRLDVR